MRRAHRRAARLALATCCLLGGTMLGRGPAARAQAPTPPPHPTQTPTPPSGTMIPALPGCTTSGRMLITPERVQVGGEVTATIELRASCPQGLQSRSAIFVVGGFDAEAAPAAVDALEILIEGLSEAGRSRAALLFAGDPAAPLTYTALPAGRDAIAAAIAAGARRPATTAAAWHAAVATAATALEGTPPTMRPLLVVADGARPSGDVGPGLASLRQTVKGLEDRLGQGLLIDLSPEAWLRAVGQGGAAPNSALIYVHPPFPVDAPSIVQNVVDALQAPINFWRLDLGLPAQLAVLQTSHAAAPDWTESNAYPWQRSPNTHEIAARMEVVLLADQTGKAMLGATLFATRRTALLRRTAFTLPEPLCIFASGLEAECDAAAPATPPRSLPPALPPPTSSPLALRTATRTPSPPGPPSMSTPTHSRLPPMGATPIYLPIARRAAVSGGRSRFAAHQSPPRPTPGLPTGPGSIVGQVPSCDVSGRVAADPVEIAVGAALTVTVEVDIRCPHTFERAAVLVALGGVDEAAVSGVRNALREILGALGNEPDGRLALLRLGQPRTAAAWAASGDERRATADAILAAGALPSPSEAAWSEGLTEAVAALDAAPLGYRPILIVVQAAAANGPRGSARGALDRTAIEVRDRVGLTIVLDASPEGSLLGRETAPPMMSMIGVIDESQSAPLLAGGVGRLLALLNEGIERVGVLLKTDGLHFDERSASPPVKVDDFPNSIVHWDLPSASGHVAHGNVRIQASGEAPILAAPLVANAFFVRPNTEGPVLVLGDSVCVYPPDVGPTFCHPPTTEPPTPSPTIRGVPRTGTPTPTPFVHPPQPTSTPSATGEGFPIVYLPVTWR